MTRNKRIFRREIVAAAAIALLALAGCPTDATRGDTFIPVTAITGAPGAATAGTPLTLAATVAPPNATNQTIAWDVPSPGTTGATVNGNTLTAAGTAAVRATKVKAEAVKIAAEVVNHL